MINADGKDTRRGRRQGVKAGIDLEQILRAASTIPFDNLTMQAVADRLGVDRKAVNHHVSDRETLLELVADDAFSRSFATVVIPAGSDWREGSRIYGRGIASAVAALGPLAPQLRVGASAQSALLAATETLLAKYVESGLDLETGLRAVALLSDICDAHGQGVAFRERYGSGRRHLWLRQAVHDQPRNYPRYLGEAMESGLDTYDERQLDVAIEIFIQGIAGSFTS
ncbi:TetR/AcrR family transcriptional regulator [Streptomyces sp. NPDC059629]|uniref:TetR/AcrR family transcriptional regulator n=1 Tax=Streptomyces sp. NPDC059629 TaxID=3346889 RepID=UPI00368C1834